MHPLLTTWRNFPTGRGPYLLPGDDIVRRTDGLVCSFEGWDRFTADVNFGAPGDSRLHLDLLPIPFGGNLKTASVFLLMLNPGFGPHDYFGEYCVPEYRVALVENLRQTGENGFFALDPQFSWHGGFDYWHGKLCKLIASFGKTVSLPYGQARKFFQARIAVIELVPYHSVNFDISDRILRELRSAQLARAFVHDELLPRAQAGKCLLVVTRAAKKWQLPTHRNVLTYTGTEARSAHLTPNSRWGSAILRFLTGAYEKRAT